MHREKKKIILWGCVILWMAVIFMFSAQDATVSSSLSNGVLKIILESLKTVLPQIDQAQLDQIQTGMIFFIRKTAHTMVYFILGVLIYMAVGKEVCSKKRFVVALMLCFLYACTDEWHQRFVPGRSGEFRDIMIDTTGALLGICFVVLIPWIRRIKVGRS